MGRNLTYQLQSAVKNTTAFGQSKHSFKGQKLGRDARDGRSYSYAAYHSKMDLAHNFGKYMQTNYPEVKLARDIQTGHVNEFLIKKSDTCTNDTLQSYASTLRSLAHTIQTTYGSTAIDANDVERPIIERSATRTVTMDAHDRDTLRESYKEGSNGYNACILSQAAGLRVEEIADIRREDIKDDGKTVYVRNGKGGRERYVTVKDNDMSQKLKDIKDNTLDGCRIVPIRADSINRSFDRHLKELGVKEQYKNTSVHAMRKLWAQERYDNLRNNGYTKVDAIHEVNEQLGHSAARDEALLERYVANIW